MCGIAGLFLHGSNSLNDTHIQDLERMTQRISHRGPDHQGLWYEDGVGFGHRRLSILDLSDSGNQPMTSADDRYVMAYNGEIYNFIELRDEIVRKTGQVFRSNSDTEVILEAISLWGLKEALPKLNGMFSLSLWDKKEEKLFLVRDAVGIKPLFYAQTSCGVLFASELKAIKTSNFFKADLDEEALGQYFSQLYVTHPRTIYKNCFKLSPGEVLEVDQGGHVQSWNFTPYSALNCDLSSASHDELIDLFESTLDRAVQRHRRADVPVASFLSGGNDSALVSALLRKSGDFKTFSIGYEEKDYDESARAGQIAEHLSLPHEKIIVSPNDARDVLDNISDFYDEPFGDASAIPTHLISKHVMGFTKVALSGDGADELFGGYPRYFNTIHDWDRLIKIPAPVRKILAGMMPRKPHAILAKAMKPILADAQRSFPYIKNALNEQSMITYFHHQNYIGLPNEVVLNSEILKRFDDHLGCYPTPHKSTLRNLLDFDQNYRLPDGMLAKVDRASMAASLEVRVPFLDNDVVALSRSLPDEYIFPRAGQAKKLLKDVLRRYLPDDIVDAPKSGFHVPMKVWLRTHFQGWAQDLLFADGDDPYLNMTYVKAMWERYCNDNEQSLFYPIWCILMYKQWKRNNAF